MKGCCSRSGKNLVAKLVVSLSFVFTWSTGISCWLLVCLKFNHVVPKNTVQSQVVLFHVYLLYHFLQKNEAFSNALSPLVARGLPVAICCGTSAWSNLAGNPEVAINNSSAAMRALRKNAGIGVINAHWSSHPSMTHVAFAYPAFLLNASLSWNSDIPESYLRYYYCYCAKKRERAFRQHSNLKLATLQFP